MSDWRRDVIWWTVYPLGFTGAPTHLDEQAPVAHRLPRLENWLDYLIDLGCNGLVLGPIFRSESHGYDTLDYFAIDPRLGDDADFDALVAACHARGIKLVLDGVFNHVSARYPAL
ncbi:MAG: alpha-amylase, partial [Propionibacterium sp.]|nr:alpha-amylase [Propionibacterium sp.]